VELLVNAVQTMIIVRCAVDSLQASVTAVKTEVIKMLDAPCKDCTERHTACHSTCIKYISFKEAVKEDKAKKEKW
jgi:hypothetical protein